MAEFDNDYAWFGAKREHQEALAITISECFSQKAILKDIIDFEGVTQKSIVAYRIFRRLFFEILERSACSTIKNEEDTKLVAEIEYIYSQVDPTLTSDVINKLFDLHADYVVLMKRRGIYDPSIPVIRNSPGTAWEKSV